MQDQDTYLMEIAKRTGIHIGKEDPILCLYVFLELFMKDLVETMKSLEAEQNANNEKLLRSWTDSAQQLSEKSLSAALSASKAHAKGLFDEASKHFQADLEALAQSVLEKKQKETRKTWILFWANMIVFALSVCVLVSSIVFFQMSLNNIV